MNVNIVRLGPVTRAITELTAQVKRLADAYEQTLAYDGIHVRPPRADMSGKEPEITYTDPELDAIRDELEAQGKMTPSLRRLFGVQDETEVEE